MSCGAVRTAPALAMTAAQGEHQAAPPARTAKGRLLTLLGLFGRPIFRANLAKSLQILAAAHDPARA
jgi:hypothetical protein